MNVLQRTQGLGVRPEAYSRTKTATTRSLNSARRSRSLCDAPSALHTLRASRACSRPQHALVPASEQSESHSCMVRPTTSAPARTRRSAATELSTPPLIATASRMPVIAVRSPQPALEFVLHRGVGGGDACHTVRQARLHSCELAFVVSRLEFAELQAVGGADHHHALALGD